MAISLPLLCWADQLQGRVQSEIGTAEVYIDYQSVTRRCIALYEGDLNMTWTKGLL